jgi:translation initiation factor IF-3
LNKLNVPVNHEIRAPEVRVLSEDGKQVGVMKIGEALAHAEQLGVDLIEIVPNATPPVVKAIEIGKYKYQEEKKAREVAKKSKGGEVKELHFSPFIGQGDFETRIRRIEEFLNDSNKVRLVVVFNNKQLGAKEHGYVVLNRIKALFADRIVVDMEPKFFGKHLSMVISPYKKKAKKIEQIQENAESKNE